jgi:hypothetical protein
MKKCVIFTFLLVFLVYVALFSQTPVNIPANFIGTWWYDASKVTNVPDGIQSLLLMEIKRDGTWISSAKLKAYNQNGLNFLEKKGFTNGQIWIVDSGYVTGATSVEIVLTRVGENKVYDRFKIDGNDIVDIERRRLVKDEPQIRWQ